MTPYAPHFNYAWNVDRLAGETEKETMVKATVRQPKPVKQPPPTVVLEMSEGAADFLLALVTTVAGHPSKSPRKYADQISKALTDALGYGYQETDTWKCMDADYRSIWFHNYDGSPNVLSTRRDAR